MKLFVTDKEIKKIQSMAVEGSHSDVDIESFLTGTPVSGSGSDRVYKTYGAQVSAIYRKYNGRDDLGNAQTRALIDLRRATIGGEGLSIQCPNENTAKWIDNFLNQNRLKGSKFFNWVLGGEMAGKSLINIVPDKKAEFVRAYHYPFNNGSSGIDYTVKLRNNYDFDTVEDVYKKTELNGLVSMKLNSFQFVKLGGERS